MAISVPPTEADEVPDKNTGAGTPKKTRKRKVLQQAGEMKAALQNKKQKKAKESRIFNERQMKVRSQIAKYMRGERVAVKGLTDKKLKGQLLGREKLYGEAAVGAAEVEQWLLPSTGGYLEAEGLEQTRNFSQEAIVQEVDVSSAKKAFDLNLPDLGPYSMDYTATGRHMVLGGRRGHIAIMDWKSSKLVTEFQVRETVRDVKFLHNELFLVAAQKKYTYIYDKKGVELHCMKDHLRVLKLEFLPLHFLLATTDKAGVLRYQDTSTGHIVAQHRTRLGACEVMRMNPYNAVLGLGHNNGTVTMWSPNLGSPLVTMLCHRGPVTAVAFNSEGQHMVTAGYDGKVKVWDVRKYTPLHTYFSPTTPKSIEISQRGMLAIGAGSGIEIWRDALATKQTVPYMKHRIWKGAQVQDIAFCPYEDVLGVGHASGFTSLLVPGSGEPNFDTYVANPFATTRQRREAEVHSLLDKLQPEMIVLDPEQIGTLQKSAKENQADKDRQAIEANRVAETAAGKAVKEKKKTKGRNKPSKRYRKKQTNIIMEKRPVIAEQNREHARSNVVHGASEDGSLPVALQRFARKRQPC